MALKLIQLKPRNLSACQSTKICIYLLDIFSNSIQYVIRSRFPYSYISTSKWCIAGYLICSYICIYIHTYIYIYTHIYIYIIYVRMYTYIYKHMHKQAFQWCGILSVKVYACIRQLIFTHRLYKMSFQVKPVKTLCTG